MRNDRCIKHLEPDLGNHPVSEIEPYEVLNTLKKFERRGIYETVNRLKAFAARVFRYAIVTGRAKVNPAADISEGLVKPKTKHMVAIIDPKRSESERGLAITSVNWSDMSLTCQISINISVSHLR